MGALPPRGVFTRPALVGGGLMMTSLTFGTIVPAGTFGTWPGYQLDSMRASRSSSLLDLPGRGIW
jgi:hypothetical protein